MQSNGFYPQGADSIAVTTNNPAGSTSGQFGFYAGLYALQGSVGNYSANVDAMASWVYSGANLNGGTGSIRYTNYAASIQVCVAGPVGTPFKLTAVEQEEADAAGTNTGITLSSQAGALGVSFNNTGSQQQGPTSTSNDVSDVTKSACSGVDGYSLAYTINSTGEVSIGTSGDPTNTTAQAHAHTILTVTVVPNTTPATITIDPASLTQTYDGTPKTISYTTTPPSISGVSVTYAGSTTPPTNAGQYTVVAHLDNPQYSASDATGTLTVQKASQTISFGPLPDKTLGDPPFQLSATASSGFPVAFQASGAACTLSGSTVTLVAADKCSITASQAGDANYNPAPSVTQSFSVAGCKPLLLNVGLPSVNDDNRRFDYSSKSLGLDFTSTGAGPSGDVVCEYKSNIGTLQVELTNNVGLSFSVNALSTTQAVVTIFEAGAASVVPMPSWSYADNNLPNILNDGHLLNGTFNPAHAYLRWFSPDGFSITSPLVSPPAPLDKMFPFQTPPMTYWLDLTALGLTADLASAEQTVRQAECYIHVTLTERVVVPAIKRKTFSAHVPELGASNGACP